jgi:hypothetical protein
VIFSSLFELQISIAFFVTLASGYLGAPNRYLPGESQLRLGQRSPYSGRWRVFLAVVHVAAAASSRCDQRASAFASVSSGFCPHQRLRE